MPLGRDFPDMALVAHQEELQRRLRKRARLCGQILRALAQALGVPASELATPEEVAEADRLQNWRTHTARD